MIKVGIIGCGHVGTAMKQLFVNAYLFDEPKKIGIRLYEDIYELERK